MTTQLEKAELEWYVAATASEAASRAKFEVEAAVLMEDLLDKRRDREWKETCSAERRVFDFVGEVSELAVESAVTELNEWAARNKSPITIRLNSPGGDVYEGLMLFDVVQDIRRSGVHVTTYAIGYAASMASILLQAGDVRKISRNSWLMIHEPSTIVLGKASGVQDEAALMQKLHRQLVGILAERSTLTEKQIISRCNRKDWWMPAAVAVRYGFADELV